MLYPTHPVAGYLLGLLVKLPALPVAVGAAIPDLIDKPLAMVGVADRYHTVAHSVFALAGLAALATRGRVWLAVAVGYASHLALDCVHMLLNDRAEDTEFLLWPLSRNDSTVQLPPLEFAAFYAGTRSFFAELAVWAGFVYALVRRRRAA
jgi:hypothetical protein